MSEITEILTPSVLQYLYFIVECPDVTERVDGGAMPTTADAHGKVLFRQQSREATFAHGSAELGVDKAWFSDAGPDLGGHNCF
jgi:hypothetical protein